VSCEHPHAPSQGSVPRTRERGIGIAEPVGRATGAPPDQAARQFATSVPTGRFSTPEEVAALVMVLASDVGANVTGSDIRIDGGLIPTW